MAPVNNNNRPNFISNAARTVGNAASNAGKAVGNAATTAGKAVGNAATTAGRAVGNAATTAGKAVGSAATTAGRATARAATATGTAAKAWHKDAVNTATNNIRAGSTGKAGTALGGLSLVNNIRTLPAKYREFVKAAESGDINAAVQKGSILAKGALSTVKGGLELGAKIQEGRQFAKVAQAATQAIGAEGKTAKAIATKAAEAVFSGKDLRKVDVLAEIAKSKGGIGGLVATGKMAIANKLKDFGLKGVAQGLEKSVAAAGRKVAAEGGEALLKGLAHGDDAAKAAMKAGKVVDTAFDAARTGLGAAKVATKTAGPLARMAGRFAPGANVAMAALDTANAVATFRDPKASTAAKITSGITALGSIAAATNIPVVSQVGAAVSTVSTIAGAVIENRQAIVDGAKKAAGAVADVASKAAGAVADTASKVGEGIANVGKKIFSGW
jgi:hypothetical protein